MDCKIKNKKNNLFSIFVKCPGILQYYKYWYTFTVNKRNVIYIHIYIYIYTKTPSPNKKEENNFTHRHYGIQRNFRSKPEKNTHTRKYYFTLVLNTVNVFKTECTKSFVHSFEVFFPDLCLFLDFSVALTTEGQTLRAI